MGTRSTVRVFKDDTQILSLYSQFDGYISGMGRDLAKVLKGRKMVNGIPGNADRTQLFNGPGCLAAQIVRGLKDDDAGGVYLEGPELDDQDYNYTIRVRTVGQGWDLEYTQPTIEVTSYGKMLFTGNLDAFQEFVMKEEEE